MSTPSSVEMLTEYESNRQVTASLQYNAGSLLSSNGTVWVTFVLKGVETLVNVVVPCEVRPLYL
jgi:hypothetical protein